MIRVLVAEDSATARSLLVQILRSDPEIQVVAEAKDGVEAVSLTQQLRPDLVTMDIHMPRMDGLEATKEIMITAPTPIVIVTASTKALEVEASMDMLCLGALDVLSKPTGPGAPDFAKRAEELIATVKAMSQVKVVRHWRAKSSSTPEPPPHPVPTGKRVRVVAVATSTGGPAALQTLLSKLPGDFPVPVLVVQHITHGFTPGLATWLSMACGLHVKVAQEGELLVPRTVYLAPDDHHLGLSPRGTVALSTAPRIGGFRPSGTFLFDSVARAFGASALAVILTGMGDDGVEGLRAIRETGGRIIAQDEKSSVVFGMPAAAIGAGLADVVLPLDAIAARLAELASSGGR